MELSRRSVLTACAATLAAAGITRSAASEATQPLPVHADPVLHAVRRLTFGATPELVAHVRSVGVPAWLDEQLRDLPDLEGELAAVGPTTLPLAGADTVSDLRVATFARAAWGTHQVREVLVEFWANHLNVCADTEGVAPYRAAYDRDVIRPYALGSFGDLLVASALSPAMLVYLDNAFSRGDDPNENYARELLELHTVGVNAGYRHRDIVDAARALSGLTVDFGTGQFRYEAAWHYVGPLRVLGWSHRNADRAAGQQVATSLLRYLATHPATARRVASKLVQRLVSDSPPAGLVRSAAAVYLAAGAELVPVVKHIVTSAAFAQSAGEKSQRPFEWFTAAVRTLGLQGVTPYSQNGRGALGALARLGQLPFGWHPPDGYPYVTVAWATTATTLARWNTAQALVRGGVAGFEPLDVDSLVGTPLPVTAGVLVDRVVARLLGVPTRPALASAVLTGVGQRSSSAIDQAAIRRLAPQMAALVLSSPEAEVR